MSIRNSRIKKGGLILSELSKLRSKNKKLEERIEELEKQLSIYSVVSSKITVSVTYLKWHDSGHALLDDYSTKETKIVKVDDIEQVNEMFTNVIKIKVVE